MILRLKTPESRLDSQNFLLAKRFKTKKLAFPVRPALFLHLDKRNQAAFSGVNIDRPANTWRSGRGADCAGPDLRQ
jgi:hypothetical protein